MKRPGERVGRGQRTKYSALRDPGREPWSQGVARALRNWGLAGEEYDIRLNPGRRWGYNGRRRPEQRRGESGGPGPSVLALLYAVVWRGVSPAAGAAPCPSKAG